jgi:hypothetical protein
MKLELPDDWQSDSLSKFMTDAFTNSVATLTNFRKLPIIQILIRVNDLFFSANKIQCHPIRELLLPNFLGRSHSAFLGSVRLSTSGQVVEAYMVARGVIENALYSLYIQDDATIDENGLQERAKIWIERDDNEPAGEKCRKEFKYGKVIKHLMDREQDIGRKTANLYDKSIARGAHPNFPGHATTSNISLEGGKIDFLIPGNNIVCKASIQFTAQVGICSLKIFELIYKERFQSQGVTSQLNDIEGLLRKV